ncbi:MAG: S8 family serine peptidase [Verrucomicrobiae bacterium]|nr:S8 family serine peptidase [Verrucomicrobiae bacterium]
MSQPPLSRWWFAAGIALAVALAGWFEWRQDWATPRKPSADSALKTDAASQKPAPRRAPRAPAARRLVAEPQPSREVAPPAKEDRLSKLLRRRLDRAGAVPNEALLKFKSPEAMREFLNRADRSKLTVLGRLDGLRAVRVRYDQLDQLRAAIEGDADIYEDIDANFVVKTPDWPDPESRPAGSGTASFNGDGFLHAIGATGDCSAWGAGVTVAVLDTGVENHPTFSDGQITHMDLVNDGQPFDGHGTAMASLIAGGDEQAPGVAPATHILDVRVADSQGVSSSFKLAEGIIRAADAGAQVINISLASYGDATVVRDAVAYALSKGAVIVAAAGNDQTANQLAFPAAISSVISVGGVDAHYQQAYFSNSGAGLDVTAPAVGILSAYGANSIVLGDGTSQAAAIASGVLAAGLSTGSTTTAAAADWLKQNALPLNLPPERGGAGMTQVKLP